MLQGPKVGSNVARSDRFFQCCKIRTLKMDLATTINIESQGQPTTRLPPPSPHQQVQAPSLSPDSSSPSASCRGDGIGPRGIGGIRLISLTLHLELSTDFLLFTQPASFSSAVCFGNNVSFPLFNWLYLFSIQILTDSSNATLPTQSSVSVCPVCRLIHGFGWLGIFCLSF